MKIFDRLPFADRPHLVTVRGEAVDVYRSTEIVTGEDGLMGPSQLSMKIVAIVFASAYARMWNPPSFDVRVARNRPA